ncbi:MAG TPA: glutamine synthetase beta-grasp domain-containing protein, partial [Ktedonobacterales bacterium]
MTPDDVMRMIEERSIRMVDLKFTDVPGTWQHFSIPTRALNRSIFSEGIGFDGSSVRGFQAINESDMLLVPDASTAILDPFTAEPTLSLVCTVHQPGYDVEPYTRDPRFIASKAEEHLRRSGIADSVCVGPEAEFFIFDDVKYRSTQNEQWAVVDSDEAHWNSGRNGTANLGHRMRPKEGYFPVAPNDTLQDLRTQMVLTMEDCGIAVEAQHHEVAAGGQCEIDMRFDSLLKMADKVMLYKYIVKNTARRAGKTATFMPKPIFGDNGSGMHVHISLWKDEVPLFADCEGYAGLSETARMFIGGLLTHAP